MSSAASAILYEFSAMIVTCFYSRVPDGPQATTNDHMEIDRGRSYLVVSVASVFRKDLERPKITRNNPR